MKLVNKIKNLLRFVDLLANRLYFYSIASGLFKDIAFSKIISNS